MAASFSLTLDTHAPQLTWGAVTGGQVGSPFSVAYSVDEPGVTSAVLELRDGSTVAMVVGAAELTCVIPGGAAVGSAVVHAYLSDSVDNTAEATLGVLVYATQTAAFGLTLDTTPPTVTWGDPGVTVGGEELSIPYLLDDALSTPSLDRAEVVLRDGRVLPLADDGTTLSVLLPEDTPDGLVTAKAYVRDDMGNTATRTAQFVVSGVPYEPPPTYVPPTGLPSPPERTRHVVDTSRTRARLRSAYKQTAVASSATSGRLRSRYTLPTPRHRHFYDSLAVASTYSVAARILTRSQGRLAESITISKRPEGPGTEDDLLLLDLL